MLELGQLILSKIGRPQLREFLKANIFRCRIIQGGIQDNWFFVTFSGLKASFVPALARYGIHFSGQILRDWPRK
jgi:hypothetical protein